MNNKILIVDDDEGIRFVIKKRLEREGYEVGSAQHGDEAISMLKRERFFLIFLDIIMPGINGLKLMDKIREIDSEVSIVVMTAQDIPQNAITAMQNGAYDYITKPFDIDEIAIIANKVKEIVGLKERVSVLEAAAVEHVRSGEIIGKSKEMIDMYKIIGKAAMSNVPVLITGESGTGKELVAKAIHKNSKRADRQFVALNCAAIPGNLIESELFGYEKGAFTGAMTSKIGKFELASGGTIFLDEIGDMDIAIQSKILRVLQEGIYHRLGGNKDVKVDVRIIAATNKELLKAVEEKSFREDLYHRLNVIQINTPPLKKRRGDIPSLVEYFLRCAKEEGLSVHIKSVTKDTMEVLKNYEWKGNVRELENVIKRGVILSPDNTVTIEYMPDIIRLKQGLSPVDIYNKKVEALIPYIKSMFEEESMGLYGKAMFAVEKVLIETVLKATKGNQVKASRILGINRNTLSKKITELKGLGNY